jgi:Activator of Hsp90 ATPase homolog 1-like protein
MGITKQIKNKMTKEKDYSASIVVDKTQSEVFEAIKNVRGWWQGEFVGETDKLNHEFTYQMGDVHFSKQKVVELIPDMKIVWLVTDSNLSFVAKKDEWTDTRLEFTISKEGNKTKITFKHSGLVPSFECYEGCSGAWEALIEKSLHSFITTGEGVKVF